MQYSNEELYWNAKRRYNNACYEITNCNNRISALENNKQHLTNQINQLEADLKKANKAFDQIRKILDREETLNEKIQSVETKTQEASVNYTAMVDASDITSKNLSELYGEESRQTRLKVEAIMATVREKSSVLSTRVEELERSLNTANQDYDTTKQQLRSTKSEVSDWERIKRNASYDMTYYRRKLEQEGYPGPY